MVKGAGVLGWLCRHAISPPSDVVHCLIIRQWQEDFSDWELEESNLVGVIPKGMQSGLLFQRYAGAEVEIYDVPICTAQEQADAPLGLLPYGDDTYDLLFYVKMVSQLPRIVAHMLFTEHRLRKFRPEDFTFDPGKMPVAICTRAVWIAYMYEGFPLIPLNVPPFPNAYMEARDQGLITLVYKGVLSVLWSAKNWR